MGHRDFLTEDTFFREEKVVFGCVCFVISKALCEFVVS